MKDLSNKLTFLTKYFVTAVWILGPISTAIIVYNKFGQVEGFYMVPIFFLPAMLTYMPMKISFDDTKIIVSDWFSREEYSFDDITSLNYSRPTISYHPYTQLEITTKDNRVRKVKFSPRTSDSFSSLFSQELKGRQKELIETWKDSQKVKLNL